MAVELAVSGENGQSYHRLSRRRLVAGLVAELRRIILRSGEPMPQVAVRIRDPQEERQFTRDELG